MPHPLVLAVLALDAVAILLVAAAAWTAARTVLGWSPGSASRAQVRLERDLEVASVTARLAAAAFFAASVAALGAVAVVLPAVVPGAMCGTGVVQAMGPRGGEALVLRGIALAALAAWHLADRLDRSAPAAPLATFAARLLLVAAPVAALAAFDTAAALLGLRSQQAVDCCAVVYDAARSAAIGTGGDGAALAAVAVAGGLLVAVAGAATAASRRLASSRVGAAVLAGLAWAWLPVAGAALTGVFASYHYGVLAHHCPWCLFAGRHGAVGFPLYGALAVAALDGGAPLLALSLAARSPDVAPAARRRARFAGLRVAVAALIFLGLAAGPALAWRARHGVWMG